MNIMINRLGHHGPCHGVGYFHFFLVLYGACVEKSYWFLSYLYVGTQKGVIKKYRVNVVKIFHTRHISIIYSLTKIIQNLQIYSISTNNFGAAIASFVGCPQASYIMVDFWFRYHWMFHLQRSLDWNCHQMHHTPWGLNIDCKSIVWVGQYSYCQ